MYSLGVFQKKSFGVTDSPHFQCSYLLPFPCTFQTMPCHGQDLLLFQEADGANVFVDSKISNINDFFWGHYCSDSR